MAVNAGSIYSSVRVRLDQLKGDVKSVETLLDRVGASSEQNAKRTEDSFTSAFDATQIAGVAAFAAITLAIKQSIKVAGDYEQSIANVQSVVMGSKATFDMLNDAAKRAGETTRFTASDAADALYNLAQGGLSATQAVDALDGVLMLAGATLSNLDRSSALMVATLNQYSMEAHEASRVSNVFAAAISSSMSTMDKLTAGMRQAGPIASAMNMTLEETVAALNAMHDAGYQGEQSGTALRSMLAFLASEADPTARKLMELGLTFDQINPAANNFADIIENISKSGADAGQIMEAFGVRAGAQMLTLLRVGRSGLLEYEQAITDTNTATEMYAIQNETLQGSLYRLKSAAESAQIEFVENFTPIMRTFLEILTAITIHVARLPGPVQIFFGILLAGIPVVLGLTKAFTALSAAMAAASGPIGWIVAGVAAAVGGFVALNDKLEDMATKKAEEEFWDLADAVGMTARELKELTERAEDFGMDVESYQEFVETLGLARAEMYSLGQMMNTVWMEQESIIPYVERWAEVLGIKYEQMVRLLHASSALSEADREILAGVIANIDAEKERAEQQEQAAKSEQELLMEQKRARVKELNERLSGMKAEGAEQQALYDIYEATLAEIDRKQRLGVVTEQEALEEKKKASDTLIKALLAQETQWLDNDEAIRTAVATGKEYADEAQAIKEADQEARDAAEERRRTLEELSEEEQRAIEQLEELGATEVEIAELQRGRRIAAIEAMEAEDEEKEAAIAAINAYYDGYVALIEAQNQLVKDDALRSMIQSQSKLMDEVGKKGEELLEARRTQAIEEAKASGASAELINERIGQINEYYDALVNEEKNKAAIKAAEDRARALAREAAAAEQLRKAQEADTKSYQEKLEDLGATELKLIELQRQRAIEGAGGNEELITSINAYYDALYETTAEDAAIAKTKAMANEIKKIWDGLSGSLAALFSALYDDKLDNLERELKAELEAAGIIEESAEDRAIKALEDAREKNGEEIALIERRLKAALDAGDEESAMFLRQQADQVRAAHAEVETEKQKAIDKARIEEDFEEKRKNLQFEAAMVSWRIQMAQAVADAAMLTMSGFMTKPFIPMGIIGGGLAATQGAIQVAAVSMAKPKLATGGIVLPRRGGTDVTLAEEGYPELALSAGPSGQELMGLFAQQIVDHMPGSSGGGTIVVNLQVDRKTLSTIVVDDINNGRVRLNR